MTVKAMVNEMNKYGYLKNFRKAVRDGKESKRYITSIYNNFLEQKKGLDR